jgi:tRNA A22 N-methylase
MKLLYGILLVGLMSCRFSSSKPDLTMSNDELVDAMIDIYTARASADLSPLEMRDSMMTGYFATIAKNQGKPIEEIIKNFEELMKAPDTLVLIQNRAMDSLRQWQTEKLIGKIDTTIVKK